MCASFELATLLLLKFCAANQPDKVKYLISVFSFVCLFNYCNRRAMLCSAALLFLAKLVNRIQFRRIALIQGWATYGPRFVRAANTFKTSVNLSYDDKRGSIAALKSQKLYMPR